LKVKRVKLKENAVFIADVHYKKGDKNFLNLLKRWLNEPPSQIFFLGDIFHLLLDFKFLKEYNKEVIDIINDISEKTEIYYTPGNHDFNIENIFPNVEFADAFVDEEKSVFLTHGDLTENDLFYKIYVKIIRSKFLLKGLHILSFNFINGYLFKKILKKAIKCKKILNFKEKVFSKIADIKYKMIIEGHYHQGVEYDFFERKYISLGAYFCKKRYYRLKNNTLKAEK